VLSKPVDLEMLLSTVSRILARPTPEPASREHL